MADCNLVFLPSSLVIVDNFGFSDPNSDSMTESMFYQAALLNLSHQRGQWGCRRLPEECNYTDKRNERSDSNLPLCVREIILHSVGRATGGTFFLRCDPL